jgi:cyclopropane fatty-acyl-phospholipid synthase-like methyltransferase
MTSRTRLYPALLLTGLIACGVQPVLAQQEEPSYPRSLDVPYVPTPEDAVKAMLQLAGVHPGDFVIDLGCGDGRIVIMAAAEFGARGIGYDLNPVRIREAEANAAKAGVQSRAEFAQKNLFEADIRKATVVTLYLLPSVNEKLKPRLLAELRPGTRVVSHSFTMPDWKPVKTVEVNGRTLYLWVIPKRAAQ